MKRKYVAFALIIAAFVSVTSGCYVEYEHPHYYHRYHEYHRDHRDWDDD